MSYEELSLRVIELHAQSLNSLWGFYFTVVIGAIAVVGSILGADNKLGRETGLALIVMLALFGCTNGWSIIKTSYQIISVIDGFPERSPDHKKLLIEQNFTRSGVTLVMAAYAVGVAVAVWFITAKTKWGRPNPAP